MSYRLTNGVSTKLMNHLSSKPAVKNNQSRNFSKSLKFGGSIRQDDGPSVKKSAEQQLYSNQPTFDP